MSEVIVPKEFKTHSKINIVGNIYTIKSIKEEEMVDLDDNKLYGFCAPAIREIFIAEDLISDTDYKEQLQATLLHEILHAILYNTGADEAFSTKSEEEAVVKALSNGLNVLGLGKVLVEEYLDD